jgi:hypothetical protein
MARQKKKRLSDLQQQRLIERELRNAGLPQNKLNSILASIDEQVKCGPVCQKMQRDQNLKRSYEDALTNYKEGPYRVREAEKNYYVAAKGAAFYNDMIKERYSKEIKEMAIANIKEHKNNVEEIKNDISQYESELIYSGKLKNLLNNVVADNEELRENIKDYNSTVYTNDRKTYYEDQQIENLNRWRRIIIILFWIIFVAYCVNLLILKQKYGDKFSWIKLLVVALVPFYVVPFIQKIILWIYHLLLSFKDMLKLKDVYIDIK